jgi:N-acetylmuramoyl-L-alanine amidase
VRTDTAAHEARPRSGFVLVERVWGGVTPLAGEASGASSLLGCKGLRLPVISSALTCDIMNKVASCRVRIFWRSIAAPGHRAPPWRRRRIALQARILDIPSPNHGPRIGGPIDILLLHYTGMPSAVGALKWLCNPRSKVSSHYLVFEDGCIVRLVDEARRAHHAGVSSWAGETDINSRSIGIEIANPGHELGYRAFPDAQVAAVVALCRDVLSRHPIPPQRVLAHSDVAPTRKQDPGELFPWRRLYEEGIGHYVAPEPLREGLSLSLGERGRAITQLRKRFRQYGYRIEDTDEFDAELAAVVTAFQRHFRPERVDGVLDASTEATFDRLLDALPT